jgi:hypothetical protein
MSEPQEPKKKADPTTGPRTADKLLRKLTGVKWPMASDPEPTEK